MPWGSHCVYSLRVEGLLLGCGVLMFETSWDLPTINELHLWNHKQVHVPSLNLRGLTCDQHHTDTFSSFFSHHSVLGRGVMAEEPDVWVLDDLWGRDTTKRTQLQCSLGLKSVIWPPCRVKMKVRDELARNQLTVILSLKPFLSVLSSPVSYLKSILSFYQMHTI